MKGVERRGVVHDCEKMCLLHRGLSSKVLQLGEADWRRRQIGGSTERWKAEQKWVGEGASEGASARASAGTGGGQHGQG